MTTVSIAVRDLLGHVHQTSIGDYWISYTCCSTRYSMYVHLTQPPGTVCVHTSHNHQVQYVCTPHTTTRYSMCVHLTQPPGTVCVYTSHNHQVQYVCTPHTTTRYSMCVHLTQPPGTGCVYSSHNHQVQYMQSHLT